jgi:transcriptional regulator with XRE-family HTH domain
LTNAGRSGIEAGMHYTQLFRQLRVARDLSHEALARRAACHRNTVINVERGRPVKFSTLARLMEKMGYPAGSDELRTMALLWLEAVSKIPFSRPETLAAARKQIGVYGRDAMQTSRQLAEIVADARLSAEQIRLLMYAARQPDVLSIVATVRKLVDAGSVAEAVPALKVAEEK